MKAMASLALAATLLATPRAHGQEAPPCEDDEDCDEGVCREGVCALELPPAPKRETVPPSGMRHETQDYLPLTIAGVATFGAAWIATAALVGASVAQEDPVALPDGTTRDKDVGAAVGVSLIPVAGPILLRSEGLGPADDGVDAVLVVLSAVQAMGLMATVLGLTIESRVEVPHTAIVPTVTPHGAGAVAVGRF
jgi:hypothetical protein